MDSERCPQAPADDALAILRPFPRPPVMRPAALPALMMALTLGGVAVANPAETKDRPANRLARETSPYLLQHAHNPVDWYPWSDEAFAKAKKEGKLVFLSIGYSSCHWCHVMERESFANRDVAKLLNQWFVCIKVDREERPDIDNIYMTALTSVLRRPGGWPLSMFLTADGKPFFGGTYWPPDDKVIEGETVHGFKSLLTAIHELQTEKAKELQEQADAVAAATKQALSLTVRGQALVKLDRELVTAAALSLQEEFDKAHGGFGSPARKFRGPKFPVPSYLQLLQQEAARSRSAELDKMVSLTLDRMSSGGIYDQLGGGFHRYSTERTWTVPHFEKMLYDNAQLLEVYAAAYRASKKPLYRRLLAETVAFVRRELTCPEGAFYSALDADSDGQEGRFYVWTDQELSAALGGKADLELFKKVYWAEGLPNFESKYHILLLPKPLAAQAQEMKLTEEQLESRLAPLRQKLLAWRSKRPRPFLDTKVLTAWNGQMIAGMALAGQALAADARYETEGRSYIEAASRAAEVVLKRLRTKDGRLLRSYSARPGEAPESRLTAYLDDYAYLVHGLLCLHDVTGKEQWLAEARALTETMVKYHLDKDRGGFFYTANDQETLFARAKDQYDSAQPSGNSMAARNLVRLWEKTREEFYRDLARKTFQAFAGSLKVNPSGLTAMAAALGLYVDAQEARGAAAPPKKEAAATTKAVKKSEAVVKVSASVAPEKPGADGKQVVTVSLSIDKDWHIGANPAGESGEPTVVSIKSRTELQDVKVDYPPGKSVKDPLGGYEIYEGKVEIKATVRRAKDDAGPLEVRVRFAACSDKEKKCLPASTVKLTVPEK